METVNIDYRSDFDLLLIFYDKDGVEIPFSKIDFSADFSTPGTPDGTVFSVSKHGDELVNCCEDSGRLRIQFNNHNLLEGPLQMKFSQIGADSIYDISTLLVPRLIGVELLTIKDVQNPVTDAILSIGVRGEPVEVPSEEYMQDLIRKGYASPGTLYFVADNTQDYAETQ